MSLLFRSGPPAAEERAYIPPFFGNAGFGAVTNAGQVVIPDNACRSAAVAACRRVLVSTIANMDVYVHSHKPDGRSHAEGSGTNRRENLPRIVRDPSARIRRRAWVSQIVSSMVLHGNAYLYVTDYTSQGYPLNAEVLHWSDVSWRNVDGADTPFVKNMPQQLFPVGKLLIIQASPWTVPGALLAQSPVELAKEALGTGLAAEEFGSKFFADGAHPSSVIYVDKEITADAAQGIKDRFMNALHGTREPAVFGSGIRLEQLPVDAKDSQFIDLMRFEIEQAARFFGVPPSMIYAAVSGQAVTYSNVGQSDTQFFKHSASSWLNDLEEGWSTLLPGVGRTVKLNVDTLLRMDAKERHNDQRVRLLNGQMTVNEARVEEDQDPFVELDDDGNNIYDIPGIPVAAAKVAELTADTGEDINDDASSDD